MVVVHDALQQAASACGGDAGPRDLEIVAVERAGQLAHDPVRRELRVRLRRAVGRTTASK